MKTERQKMLDGEFYDCQDPQLQQRWHVAKDLQRQLLMTDTRDRVAVDSILDQLLGSRGENVWVAAPICVDYGENIHLGNGVEINMNCVFLDCNWIDIGDNSGIGPAVQIYTVFHPVDPVQRLGEQGCMWRSQTRAVKIGRNVWIGGGAVVLPGVTIGDNSTIGAGSVVTGDIPADCVAVGNPCRVVRFLESV